jgi:hypothetical protein
MTENDTDSEEFGATLERNLEHALANPMPRELKQQLMTLIEPHTINMYLKHGDVMECIDVAYPAIRDYLREHGET